jgi:hypothetical protein
MIFVTGGTGTVGRPLLRYLTAIGQPVRALCRSERKAEAVRGYRLEPVLGNFDDINDVQRAMKGCDRARTLLRYQGMMFHLIESDEAILDNVIRVHQVDPEFRELSPYPSPIVTEWTCVLDSKATEFYQRSWLAG